MTKHIHIHIHRATRDAEFKESDHPRRDDGKFGSGSGKPGSSAKKSAGSSAPLHVQKQRRLDEAKAASANPNLHNHLGSGEGKASASKMYAERSSSIASHLDAIAAAKIPENESVHGTLHDVAEFLGADTKGKSKADTVKAIRAAMQKHGTRAAGDPDNWGHAGDLGNVEKQLAEAVREHGIKPATAKAATGAEKPAPAPSKKELAKQAKAEHEAAGLGRGNYAKAAELYRAADMGDKAAAAEALAKRYGHDAEGQGNKGKADREKAEQLRAESLKHAAAGDTKKMAAAEKLANLYSSRSKDPESNELTKQINALNDSFPR